MRRIISVLAVMALMAAMVAVSVVPAFAEANNPNGADAPGQANAGANCFENVLKQFESGVAAGGGPKEEFLAPTNCDHFFQEEDLIGNQ